MVRHLPFFDSLAKGGSAMCNRLETERLLLRRLDRSDMPAILPLLNEWDVAKTLGRVPHPYTEEMAQEFFDGLEKRRAEGTDFNFAILRKSDREYLGGCGVHLRENGQFELGYWIGKPYWGNGYATEAARAASRLALVDLKVTKLTAGWFVDNPPSGRVLAKLGFAEDGMEQRDCRARGHAVTCHKMVLTPELFGLKEAA
jgi:RimJ/RimL family protein N-acetyltransferase